MTSSEQPKVTVVVPAYNMERFIERTLSSALGQTYDNFDIQVVDDGSTDGTRDIVERMARAHDNLHFVTVENAGVAEARNLGTRLARGLYVAYLDADDLWHPEKIERQVAALAAHGHSREWAGCYASFRVIDANDQVMGDGLVPGFRGDFFAEHLLYNPIANGSSLLVRRDVALEVGGYNPEYAARGIGGCEDVEFQLKVLREHKVELAPGYLVGYRIHARQMSGFIDRMREGEIAVIDAITGASDFPPRLRRRGLVHVYIVAFKAFVSLRKWKAAWNYLRSGLRLGVGETIWQLLREVRSEVLYRWQIFLRKILGVPDRAHIGMPFASVAADAGVGERWAYSAQYRWTLRAANRQKGLS